MICAIKLCRIQEDAGRFFMREHPSSASSWKIPEMVALMQDVKIDEINAHMCRFEWLSEDEAGIGLAKKRTGLLTNSEHLREQLSKTCLGGHRHVHLMGGKAKACRVYPPKLARAIC